MKLKHMLLTAFLTLTLIPIFIASLLLYRSGLQLSHESYMRNLEESISVQADHISQTIGNKMISDSRFVNRIFAQTWDKSLDEKERKSKLLEGIQSYLDASEDKAAVCILLDAENKPLYSIGDKTLCDAVNENRPAISEMTGQMVREFELQKDIYSLGIITPAYQKDGSYGGALISVYDKSYLFKIISSFYEVADTTTYIVSENGRIINTRTTSDTIKETNPLLFSEFHFEESGRIDLSEMGGPKNAFYKNIHTAPWYLVGMIDEARIYDFTNQFVWIYMAIIALVLVADILLSITFSQKVVEPINSLIELMDHYKNNQAVMEPETKKGGYYETKYLRTKFTDLMKTILLVQHNFEGVYQLYQSGAIDDINIDIDVKRQTIFSDKKSFQDSLNAAVLPPEVCIVERFANFFCKKDCQLFMNMFETMRQEHLAGIQEAEVYTSTPEDTWYHAVVAPMYEDDRLARLFIQLRNITSFKKQEQKSSEQAKRDVLTGLYNRLGFAGCVEDTLHAKDSTKLHALLFLDMNNFKLVNDNLGHSAGDELLQKIAANLLSVVGEKGVVSRFGGDEFAVFLPDTCQEELETMQNTIHQCLTFSYQTDTISFQISASIGVSTWTYTTPDTLDKLIQQADTAMYKAKRKFKLAHH